MGMTLKEYRANIVAGKHTGWNAVVDTLRLGKTPLQSLTVWEAFPLVAHFQANGTWTIAAAAFCVTRDDVLQTIAGAYVWGRGQLVRMPLAFVFVGECEGRWAKEAAFVELGMLGFLNVKWGIGWLDF